MDKHFRLNWNFILPNNETLAVLNGLVRIFVPGVLFDLGCSESLLWVCLHDFVQHVLAVFWESLGHLKLAR